MLVFFILVLTGFLLVIFLSILGCGFVVGLFFVRFVFGLWLDFLADEQGRADRRLFFIAAQQAPGPLSHLDAQLGRLVVFKAIPGQVGGVILDAVVIRFDTDMLDGV